MNISAYKQDDHIHVAEPVNHTVRFTVEERDGMLWATLNEEDLSSLYEAMPHGASQAERGDIELYLCRVAEDVDD